MNVMKRFFCCAFLCYLLFTSCEFHDDGSASLTPLGWVVIIFIVLFIIWAIIDGNRQHKKAEEILTNMGISFSDFKSVGMYVGGHPSINESKKGVYAFKKDDNLILYTQKAPGMEMPELIENSEIPIKDIKDIKLEDASSIEHRITVGRLILVGIFAFAWKKKKKNEVAFVSIVWTKGKFEQGTTFMFEGKDAFQQANTSRNKLMELCM